MTAWNQLIEEAVALGAFKAGVIPVSAVSFDRSFRDDWLLVYQTVSRLEDSFDFEGMMEAAHQHSLLSRRMEQLCAGRIPGQRLHLGAGGCHVCDTCSKVDNEPCRHPDQAMASLEGYGVNVSELAAASGMKYINGQNTVTYFGAVFFKEG